jgi:CRISPR/Cas system CMR-associated protein Cmr5 small subunit
MGEKIMIPKPHDKVQIRFSNSEYFVERYFIAYSEKTQRILFVPKNQEKNYLAGKEFKVKKATKENWKILLKDIPPGFRKYTAEELIKKLPLTVQKNGHADTICIINYREENNTFQYLTPNGGRINYLTPEELLTNYHYIGYKFERPVGRKI